MFSDLCQWSILLGQPASWAGAHAWTEDVPTKIHIAGVWGESDSRCNCCGGVWGSLWGPQHRDPSQPPNNRYIPTKHAARNECGKGFIVCFFRLLIVSIQDWNHLIITSVEVQLYNHIGWKLWTHMRIMDRRLNNQLPTSSGMYGPSIRFAG